MTGPRPGRVMPADFDPYAVRRGRVMPADFDPYTQSDATSAPAGRIPWVSPSEAGILAANEMSFGLGKRASAALDAVMGRGTYGENVAKYQQRLDEAGGKYGAFASKLGGNLPQMLPTAGAVAGLRVAGKVAPEALSTARQMWNGLKTGAGYGTVVGAGHSDFLTGQPGYTPLDEGAALAGGAGGGALIGGGLGALIPGAFGAARSLGRLASENVGKGATLRRVNRQILGALNEANVPIASEQKVLELLRQSGKPVVLGDVGGRGALAPIARAAAASPGPESMALRETLAAREVARGRRMAGDVDPAVGLPRISMPQRATELRKEAGTTADRMWADARANSEPIPISDDLAKGINTRTFRRAFDRAQAQRQPGVDAGKYPKIESPFTTQGERLSANPTDPKAIGALARAFVAGESNPTIAAFKMGAVINGKVPLQEVLASPAGQAWAEKVVVKEHIDPTTLDAVITQLGEMSGGAPRAQRTLKAGYTSLKDQYLGTIRDGAPLFAEARDQMAETMGRAKATETGRDIARRLSGTHSFGPGDIEAAMDPVRAHMTDLRQGAAAQLRQSFGSDRLRQMLDPAKVAPLDENLATVLGRPAAERLRASASAEASMLPLEEAVAGARPTSLTQNKKDLAGPVSTALQGSFTRINPTAGGILDLASLRAYLHLFSGPAGQLSEEAANTAAKAIMAEPSLLGVFARKQAGQQGRAGLLNRALRPITALTYDKLHNRNQ